MMSDQPDNDAEEKYPDNSRFVRDTQASDKPLPDKIIQLEDTNIPPKVSPVAKATIRKRSIISKVNDSFFGETMKAAGAYVWKEIIVPTLKDLFRDSIMGAIDIRLYGDTRGSGRLNGKRNDNGRTTRVSYSEYYDRPVNPVDDRGREVHPIGGRSRFNFTEYVFASKREAQDVLDGMLDYIDTYKIVKVSDFMDLIEEPSDAPMHRWGWDRLADAYVAHIRDGWVLILPQPFPLR